MRTNPDVLVVGGGVIGLTIAYQLADTSIQVELVDAGEFGREASWAGAGILPPWGGGEWATPLDKLRALSLMSFEMFSRKLREQTGIDNEYHVCGGVEFLSAENADQTDLWRDEGIRFERYDGLCPAGTTGYHLPYAQVRNPRHVAALIDGCRRLGVTMRPHTRLERLPSDDETCVVLTAGAWTGELLARHGVSLPVVPVKGQIVLFNPGQPALDGIRVHGKRYLVPRRDGRVLAGSTEESTGFDKSTTADGVSGLIDFAHSMAPELRSAPVEASWAGLRPATPDGMPYIGQLPGFGRTLVAAGHFRAGIQLSYWTAELVTELILGERPSDLHEAFAVGRTPHPPMRSAFRS